MKRTMWIDVLCINQDDVYERNNQVSRMKNIYENANLVIVWLGQEADKSHLAFETLGAMADQSRHLDQSLTPSVNPELLDREHINSLICFISRQWWKRVWTVQETVLAPHLLFFCGSQTIEGQRVFSAMRNYFAHLGNCCGGVGSGSFAPPVLELVFPLRDVEFLHLHRERHGQIDLTKILTAFRQRECFDARDKIYGFLGLATGNLEGFLMPNYQQSTQRTFEQATLELVRRTRNLEMLSHLDGTIHPNHPSWVPTWTKFEDEESFHLMTARLDRALFYNACGDKKADLVSLSPGKASVSGILFDCIEKTGEFVNKKPEDCVHKFKNWRTMAERTPNPEAPYSSQAFGSDNEFWITLVNAALDDKERAGQSFDHMIRIREQHGKYKPWYEEWWASLESEHVKRQLGASSFHNAVRSSTTDRRFLISKSRYIGIGPPGARAGDLIAILHGGRQPYILRASTSLVELKGIKYPQYYMLGDAYIHNLMNGEVITLEETDQVKEQTLILILQKQFRLTRIYIVNINYY
ncbi:MAG: hypothetical protein ALECFALPRED_002687 [Alectoria fallacina]|uniref:Heterokaryon incompatibility domain-containing protein n=1 Tax=Alectoria fallacina TaxID=1903189 RepID=A0A8H3FDR8_9LECA|nr:MAG: hypothetical protein ALECFALPRED_002687 [Alectoria fallacina]